jgi:hypothetical protein
MVLWIVLGVGFLVVLALLARFARHADRVEDDSTYLREEREFTPYGQKYVDIMLFRKSDD